MKTEEVVGPWVCLKCGTDFDQSWYDQFGRNGYAFHVGEDGYRCGPIKDRSTAPEG